MGEIRSRDALANVNIVNWHKLNLEWHSGSVHILSESSQVQVATCVEALLGVSIVRVENTPLASGVEAVGSTNFKVECFIAFQDGT